MDCNNVSDMGVDSPLSNNDNSDLEDEMKECNTSDLCNSKISSVLEYNRTGGVGGDCIGVGSRSPDLSSDIPLSHHAHFAQNQPFGTLGNLIGGAGLHNLPNLQHGNVLEKLKMQVLEMKAGLMDQEYPMHANFPASLTTPANTAFLLPPVSSNSFAHTSQNFSHAESQQQNSHSHLNGYSFTSPNLPCTKDANSGSNSSTSSEASNSSQQNNGWSFEEQYKQVRQLYEINDDPKRKEFLDDLFSFMQKRGTPINRLPIMAKSVLDLYELYNLVIARGGLVDVINKKLWQEIIKGLHLPSSITSAAFTLRTQYMKYLYPYECEKKNLSSPSELQAAIDGNRREGRRSSYGQFEAMHSQLQLSRSNGSNNMQQMSPLVLVNHANQQSAAVAAVHHRLMAPPLGQMPNIVTHEFEQRMMEYLKLFQSQQKENRRSQSPEDALNALEMSRVALWSMYHNNTSPPSSVNTSPQGVEPQSEALNLSDAPVHVLIKRENENLSSGKEDPQQPPPPKKRIKQAIQNDSNNLQISTTTEVTRTFDDEDNLENFSTDTEHLLNNHQSFLDSEKTNHLMQISSPVKDLLHDENLLQTGMQFKITQRGNEKSGERELFVNLELNGIKYEGVLLSNPTIKKAAAIAPVTSSVTSCPLVAASPSIVNSNITKRSSTEVIKEISLEERDIPS